MALMRNFKKSSVRQGYMIEQELPYHTEILSLHGFHFELKTVKTGDCFTFFMQVSCDDPVDPLTNQICLCCFDREPQYHINNALNCFFCL